MNPTNTAEPRRRVRWVALFFTVVAPLTELASIILVGQQVGVAATVGLLLAGVVVGGMLISAQGRKAREHLQAGIAAAQAGQPVNEAKGAGGRGWLVVAGLLFIAPGFASDVVALALFIPPIRTLLTAALVASGVRWFQKLEAQVVPPGSPFRPGDVVPGQVVDEHAPDPQSRREVSDPGVIEGRIVGD